MNSTTLFSATRALRLVALALVAVFAAAGAQASMRWATLEAIHQVENPRNVTTPGRFGELGAYQFRECTWQMHTSVPFAHALDRRASDEVAVKHYEYLKRKLEAAGLPVTPYNIALAWNGGPDAAVLDHAIPATRAYAERVANLAASLNAVAMR